MIVIRAVLQPAPLVCNLCYHHQNRFLVCLNTYLERSVCRYQVAQLPVAHLPYLG